MGIDFLSLASFGFLFSSPAVGTKPNIASSTAGDTQVTLTIDAVSSSDIIYARYRKATDEDWSDESDSFKVTGDGDIVITGLTNGVVYQFGVYAKSSNLTSVWDFALVTPTSSTATPTDLDTEFDDEVYDLIEDTGITAKFYTYGTESYDPTTGEFTRSGASVHTEKVTPPVGYDNKFIDGDTVKEGDMNILLSNYDLSFDVVPGVEVEFNDQRWKVVTVKPIYSGEQISVWDLQIRRE